MSSQTSTPSPTPISTTTPTPLSSPTSGGVTTIIPTEDSYIKGDYPSLNYGLATQLNVDGSPVRIAYMKFDLTSLAGRTITSAKLRLRITGSSSSTQNIKTISNSWSQSTVTYNTRPALGSVVTTFVGGSSGVWKEIDLTSFVNSNKGNTVSIAIDSAGGDGLDFYSKESSIDKPYLQIQ